MDRDARIFVAGGGTMIGSAILRRLAIHGFNNIVGRPGEGEPDPTDARAVEQFFDRTQPQYVFCAAGRSGGISANIRSPAGLMQDNLLSACHLIDAAQRHGVDKLLYLASSCTYPRDCPQPMQVGSLLGGPLEPTCEPYAISRIAGIKLCQAYRAQHGCRFIAGIPADAFGPGEDHELRDLHVVPALLRKMLEARSSGDEEVVVWGTGKPRRELIHVDDLAEACLLAMQQYDDPEPINLGSGTVLSIAELASMIQQVVGFEGRLRFDTTRPDGAPHKSLDSSLLAELGFVPSIGLEHALGTMLDSLTQQSDDMAPVTPANPLIEPLERKARQIRATCVQMSYENKHGHLGSALSWVDLAVALFHGWLRLDPEDPRRPDRDRFILSKGHGCTPLYAVLADRGFIPQDWLLRYGQPDSPLSVHPCQHALPVVECSSGSLGHGLGIATGMLYGQQLASGSGRAIVLMSDGECNEGSVWESAMFAAAQGLDRLLAIVDYNGIQAVGRSDELMGHTCLAEKFEAFGWGARTIDGHCMSQILSALEAFPFRPGRPSVIVANTVGGAGVSVMEDQVLWHYRVPSADDHKRALEELAATPIHIGER